MLLLGLLGYKMQTEAFENKTSDNIAQTFLILTIIYVIIIFIYSYGAAKLSWGYNYYLGNGWGLSFFNSILAFTFSEVYYPMYSYFLNPIYNIRKVKNN
jgi:hypothetical protein